MGSRVAWSSIVILLVLALAQSGPARAQSASGVWDMVITARGKGAGGKASFSGTGTLTLDPDRTYALETDGDPLIEEGVWFQDGKHVNLFATNILEMVIALEAEVSAQVGEPVEVIPLKSNTKCALNPNTGLLSVKTKQSVKVIGLTSGTTIKLGVTTKATGTRAVP